MMTKDKATALLLASLFVSGLTGWLLSSYRPWESTVDRWHRYQRALFATSVELNKSCKQGEVLAISPASGDPTCTPQQPPQNK